jgi:hypothetical protein
VARQRERRWRDAVTCAFPLPLTRDLMRAPTATRTRDLLLRRHFRNVARWCQAWPDVPIGCTASSSVWPEIARDLWSLAPRLAPRNLVSNANVRMTERNASIGSRNLTRLSGRFCGLRLRAPRCGSGSVRHIESAAPASARPGSGPARIRCSSSAGRVRMMFRWVVHPAGCPVI